MRWYNPFSPRGIGLVERGTGGDRLLRPRRLHIIDRGRGGDTIDAEAGNDVVRAADGRFDSISCGIGPRDRAVIDEEDLRRLSFEDFVRITSCEIVTIR